MSEGSRWVRVKKRREPDALDWRIAVPVGLFCLFIFLTVERTAESPAEADALGVALVVVAGAALVCRRRWPVPVLLVTAAATVATYLLDYPDSGLPTMVLIALYTVASRCTRRTTVAATLGLLVAIVLFVAPAADFDSGTFIATLAIFTAAAAWGDRTKVREAYAEQVELRAAEKERERIEATRRAAAEERLRIARELHDVVAHGMSVVAVQSGVGAHVIDSRPDEAKRILETISQVSRDSLEEMRRLLGVLRADSTTGDAAELAPAAGLSDLDTLVGRVIEAGVPVSVDVRGDRNDLPTGVDLAAYRIVQEALTNVLKHAGPARAAVHVRYEPGAVHVEVVDDGRGAATAGTAAANGSGHGLVGMGERAALYGGDLEAGPRPGGGYRVAATLRYGTP